MQPKIKFLGVYSSAQTQSRNRRFREFFFVWQVRDGQETYFRVQEIDESYAPKSKVYTIDQSTLSFFKFEPSILAMPLTTPEEICDQTKREQPQVKPSDQADQMEAFRAQVEARTEKLLRTDFEQAMLQLNQPKSRLGALRYIKTIPNQKEIKPSHKHMLRDFTIELRKNSLPEIALLFATKTVELAPNDDHAHFNLARIYTILERYKDALVHVRKAISLQPDTEDELVYRKLLTYIEQEDRRHARASVH